MTKMVKSKLKVNTQESNLSGKDVITGYGHGWEFVKYQKRPEVKGRIYVFFFFLVC